MVNDFSHGCVFHLSISQKSGSFTSSVEICTSSVGWPESFCIDFDDVAVKDLKDGLKILEFMWCCNHNRKLVQLRNVKFHFKRILYYVGVFYSVLASKILNRNIFH